MLTQKHLSSWRSRPLHHVEAHPSRLLADTRLATDPLHRFHARARSDHQPQGGFERGDHQVDPLLRVDTGARRAVNSVRRRAVKLSATCLVASFSNLSATDLRVGADTAERWARCAVSRPFRP